MTYANVMPEMSLLQSCVQNVFSKIFEQTANLTSMIVGLCTVRHLRGEPCLYHEKALD